MSQNGLLRDGPETWYRHRVSYGETDTMGVLYYAEYLHIFERARSQFIRETGLSYKDVESRGLFLPVREAQCRYRHSAHYDDLLVILTLVSEETGFIRVSLRSIQPGPNKAYGRRVYAARLC